MRITFVLLSVILLLIACQQEASTLKQTLKTTDLEQEKAFLTDIKHPAGTISDYPFLPYPANLGICNNNASLEVLTLAAPLDSADQIAVYPIATLLLEEAGKERPIIIASPVDTTLQIINTVNYQQFLIQQSGMRQVLQDWFLYEKGLGKVELIDWKDERFAWKLVKN